MTRGRRRKERTVDPANVFGRVLSPDTGRELSSVHFTDFRSSDTDPRSEEPNTMTGRVYPLGIVCPRRSFGENGGNSTLEPYVGQEFDTSDEARDFYNMYANYLGFKMRVGQLYRSRVDGSVSNRRFVCSKEGFQINSRTGCPAFVRVKKCDSGKWMFDQFAKDHNHDLEPSAENDLPVLQCKSPFTNGSTVQVGRKPRNKIPSGIDDGQRCPSSVVNVKRIKLGVDDGQAGVEPTIGLEFNTASEAYQFYNMFAMKAGFRVRIGQLFRSKLDGSVTSRRFVCSKEGFQHPSRVGCGAFMRIKRQDSGRWVVDRYQVQHNHELEAQIESARSSASRKLVEEESNGGFEKNSSTALVNISHGRPRKVHRSNNIENDWYPVLLDYFQAKQAEEMGFFYAVEMQMGRSRNLFWADRRSRFACTQFGDAIVFDTSYRSGTYLVPLATFTGVNHHKQPVLLGCALLADESKESFAWLFQTWMKSMSGRRPKSIIADQDKAIREAISSVFPGTHHRFSMWQIKEKERELLSTVNGEFKYEYDRCVFQSQTTGEFDSAWTALLHKYGLRDNTWLNEMYEYRENWVPLYLRGTFFAGIPFSGLESFFGTFLNAQTPLADFIGQYEQTLEQRREDERKEDYNSFNLQAFLQTEEPVEEQCRRLYTLVMFKVFQKELMQSYSYLGSSIYEEGTIARYLIRKCGNEPEKHIVTFNASNLEVSCGCQMFESEGMLCRHVLRLFQSLDVREIPSRYILHRWTRNAEYGIVRDLDSGGGNSPQELKAMMTWSLREMASKYIESGTTSFDKYKLAFELMRDGGRKLSWQR